jgi:hypothetical protein
LIAILDLLDFHLGVLDDPSLAAVLEGGGTFVVMV